MSHGLAMAKVARGPVTSPSLLSSPLCLHGHLPCHNNAGSRQISGKHDATLRLVDLVIICIVFCRHLGVDLALAEEIAFAALLARVGMTSPLIALVDRERRIAAAIGNGSARGLCLRVF